MLLTKVLTRIIIMMMMMMMMMISDDNDVQLLFCAHCPKRFYCSLHKIDKTCKNIERLNY